MRRIPPELIEHLEWQPGAHWQQPHVITPTVATHKRSSRYSIEDILKGKTFYSEQRDGGNYVGVPIALKDALEYATPEGIVATIPELIAAKIKAEKSHEFWQKWLTAQTEENIGVDKKGRFYTKDQPVLVIVNGGGILTPERIKQAYTEGLINNSAKYTATEFDGLLDGKLPSGEQIHLYKFEDIKTGVSNLPHQFGIVMPYSTAQSTNSGYHTKADFVNNPLVIARAAGSENLETYYDLAKGSSGLGNWHPFAGRDSAQAQGRLLFLYLNDFGLIGYYLNYVGRFVGVAPEAPGARK